jgi:hypothetical protein
MVKLLGFNFTRKNVSDVLCHGTLLDAAAVTEDCHQSNMHLSVKLKDIMIVMGHVND